MEMDEPAAAASRRARIVAVYQLVTAAAYVISVLFDVLYAPDPPSAILVGAAALNAVAGALLFQESPGGYRLSVFNQLAQIPVIVLPWFAFHYMGVAGIVPVFASPGGMGAHVYWIPGFAIGVGDVPRPYYMGLNLLPLGVLVLLLSAARRPEKRGPDAIRQGR